MSITVLSVGYPLAPVGPDVAGGSEQVLTLLDRTLTRLGHRSIVIAPEGSTVEGTLVATPWPSGPLDDEVREKAHCAHREAINTVLRRWHVDLIHMHGLDFHQYLPPAGVPVITTLHLPPDWYPQWIFNLDRPDTYLHCVSFSQQAACPPGARLLPPIENGVPVSNLATHVRKRNYVLALGRICPEKGFHVALDAAVKAGVPLVLAGEIFRYAAHEHYFETELAPRLHATAAKFIGPVGFDLNAACSPAPDASWCRASYPRPVRSWRWKRWRAALRSSRFLPERWPISWSTAGQDFLSVMKKKWRTPSSPSARSTRMNAAR